MHSKRNVYFLDLVASTMPFLFEPSGYGAEHIADWPVARVKNVFNASELEKKFASLYRKRHHRIPVADVLT